MEARSRGQDPSTFGYLAGQYLEKHAKPRKKSWREDQRQLEGHILPPWRDRPYEEIKRRDVRALVEAIAAGQSVGNRDPGKPAPVAANRALALVSRVFRFAVDEEYLETNPAHRVRRPGGKEEPRDRVLRWDELSILWPALDDLEPMLASCWRLILLTAGRPGEVLRMRWCDLERDQAGYWWTVPKEHSKVHTAHRRPLSVQAAQIIDALRDEGGACEYVFPSRQSPAQREVRAQAESERRATTEALITNGKRPRGAPLGNSNRVTHGRYAGRQVAGQRYFSPHLTSLATSTALLVKATGLPRLTPHDLRRTSATLLGDLGTPPHVVERLLGHHLGEQAGVGKTAKVYNRSLCAPEMRQALQRLADYLDAVRSGNAAGRVLPFPRG